MKNKKVIVSTSLVLIVIIVLAVTLLMANTSSSSKKETSKTTKILTSTTNTSTTLKPADSISTIESPQKIDTLIGNQYFYYGAPDGQNNISPKKIIITLHGTEGTAERDYEVWKPFIKDTTFALASLNWWDGAGDTTQDYSTPEIMNQQIHEFLIAQGYTSNDIVVFEGFSRGSANSYSIVAHDQASTNPLIKFAISSSGSAQEPYYDLTTSSISSTKQTTIFSNVKWILACGDKDTNPDRDGCVAMEKSTEFLKNKGANVLAVLKDPNGGHGALTTSNLNLAKQAIDLIDQNS